MKKLIDLSMVIEEGMQTFPAYWHPLVEIVQLGRHGIEGRETRKLVLGTHVGTHIDAPRHFIKDGKTIEQIPLSHLNGQAVILDFSSVADFVEIQLEQFLCVLGDSQPERLIFRFDWDRMLGTPEYYTNHPYLSAEICYWLVANKCKLIALDTPQPDNPKNGRGCEKDALNHKILLSADVMILEYLVNIKEASKKEVELVVAPIKIKEGDGAPVRCFILE